MFDMLFLQEVSLFRFRVSLSLSLLLSYVRHVHTIVC